jgi:peptidoglycan/xylan/chitin deacetylase (PgdA/CDA1 family)
VTGQIGLRKFLRLAVAVVFYYTGMFRLQRLFLQKVLRRKEVCILGLHRVLSDNEHSRSHSLDGMVLKETTFVEMLQFLRDNFTVLSLDSFLCRDWGGGTGPKPPCLISFDDGWRDNYTTAYPWLKKLRIPAVIFLVTGHMGDEVPFWPERVNEAWQDPSTRKEIESRLGGFVPVVRKGYALDGVIEFLKRMPADQRKHILTSLGLEGEETHRVDNADAMMSWSEILEMSKSGVDFGAHTVSHPLLVYEDEAVVNSELEICKSTLEEKLARRVRAFAYPNGDWNERVREVVKKTGYECAFTTQRGWYRSDQDPFTICRILLHEGNVTWRAGKFSPAMFVWTLTRRN